MSLQIFRALFFLIFFDEYEVKRYSKRETFFCLPNLEKHICLILLKKQVVHQDR